MDIFFKCDGNASETARIFHDRHPDRPPIHYSSILRLHLKFVTTGSVTDKKPTGRHRTATDKISSFHIMGKIETDPNTSIGKLAHKCLTTPNAIHRILSKNCYRPYKIRVLQVLSEVNYSKSLQFCQWLLEHGNIGLTMFTYEAVFYLNGTVSKPHYWVTKN